MKKNTICSEAVHYRKSTEKYFLHVGIQKDLVFCVKYINIHCTKNTEHNTCTALHTIIHILLKIIKSVQQYIELRYIYKACPDLKI